VNELSLLTFTLSATDSDLPAQTLTYSLVSGPVGMTVSGVGAVRWTPTELQGPSANTVVVRVSDGVASVNTTFTVTVSEVNTAPILATVATGVNELSLLTFTLSATDIDLPVQTLTYSLVSGPVGMTVSGVGAVNWTPTEAQGPSANTVVVKVSDGAADVTTNFTVNVSEVNTAPIFATVANKTVNELSLLTFNLSATDSDLPAQTLTYSLVSGPAGMTVSGVGAVNWTPTEAQGPSTLNIVTVRVSDGVANRTTSFIVTVAEVNVAPIFAAVASKTVNELSLLTFNLSATDSDRPLVQTLTYGLVRGPVGMTVSGVGAVSWTPTEAQGPMVTNVLVKVSDGTASVTNAFNVTVSEVNTAPSLAAVADKTVAELATLSVTLSASDTDLPLQSLTYSLVAGEFPTGMVLTGNTLTWTPTEAQGPSVNTVGVRVSDGSASVTNRFTVEVTLAPPQGFVLIQPGTFVMGSPVSEANREGDEVQHTVTLTQSFWMSDHETTQEEYQLVMGSNPSSFRGGKLPVESVLWDEAVEYCLKLTERERAVGRITALQAYRLPTESEWEYAARAGTTGERYGELGEIAWWSGNSGNSFETHVVKGKQANAWGLYDMMGNVYEWCGDWYGRYPTGSVTDPTGPNSGSGRVCRGGSWYGDAGLVRSASRVRAGPGRDPSLGFRPVLSSVR
jgi:formylglycine-generating enzyme required for sulfatase activity